MTYDEEQMLADIEKYGLYTYEDFEEYVPEESRQFVAMINGERKLFNNAPYMTQFCMSNPKAREKLIQFINSLTDEECEMIVSSLQECDDPLVSATLTDDV